MNYCGTARSNYVTITDFDALMKAIDPFDITAREHRERKGMYAFFDSADYGWPENGCDESGNDIELDIGKLIMPHVREGEVLVVMDVGSEGHRYVCGWAKAWIRRGEQAEMIQVSLDSIYEQAAIKFGVPASDIPQAVY